MIDLLFQNILWENWWKILKKSVNINCIIRWDENSLISLFKLYLIKIIGLFTIRTLMRIDIIVFERGLFSISNYIIDKVIIN